MATAPKAVTLSVAPSLTASPMRTEAFIQGQQRPEAERAALLATACPHDRVVCALFGGYAVYQLYAAAWQYRLWKLNGARHTA